MASPIRILHNELINLKNKLEATTPAAISQKVECEGWDASLVLIQESGGVSVALTAINTNDLPHSSPLNRALEALPLPLTLMPSSVMNNIIELNGYYRIGTDYHEEDDNNHWRMNLLLRRISGDLKLGTSAESSVRETESIHIAFSINV